MKYEFDATNESLGRFASKIASHLRGKNSPDFTPNKAPEIGIIVKNIKKIKFTGKKIDQKRYYRYSGYHGGIRELKLSELWEKKPEEVLKNTVYDMLPKNKLRSRMIKNLKFE